MAVRYKLLAAVLAVAQAPYPASKLHPPPAWFVDVAVQAGVQMNNVNGESNTKKYIIETTGSGVAVLDYDRDGWPDIYLVNGDALDAAHENLHQLVIFITTTTMAPSATRRETPGLSQAAGDKARVWATTTTTASMTCT